MKKLTTIILSLLFVGVVNSQPCSDLFISEVVFGNQGSSFGENNVEQTFKNYSVELFNPTDLPINLSSYKIELISTDSIKSTMVLSGIIDSKETYVVSNSNATSGISSVSDTLTNFLDFEEKVVLQISKNNIPIDIIGQQGFEADIEEINIDSLLNNPSYIEGIEINLGSIRNLLVRRKGLIQNGNINFETEDILNEWKFYPNFEISNLGYHFNACVTPLVFWENVQDLVPDAERLEANATPVVGTLKCTENLNEEILLIVENVLHDFIAPPATEAFAFEDFLYTASGVANYPIELTLPPGNTWDHDLISVIDDFFIEGDEGTAFAFNVVNGGSTGAETDFDNNHFDIIIFDDETTSSKLIDLKREVNVVPTIVKNNVIISANSDSNILIEAIRVYGLDSRSIKGFYFDGEKEVELDLSGLGSFGYHVLYINTNEGLISKKIIKVH